MQSGEPEGQGAVPTPARAQPPGFGSPVGGRSEITAGVGNPAQRSCGAVARPPPSSPVRSTVPLPHPPAGGPCALGPHWVSGTSAGLGPGSGHGPAAPGRSAPCRGAGDDGGDGGGGVADASGPWVGPAPGPFPLMAGPQTGWSCSGLSPSLGPRGVRQDRGCEERVAWDVHAGAFQVGLRALWAPSLGPRMAWCVCWGGAGHQVVSSSWCISVPLGPVQAFLSFLIQSSPAPPSPPRSPAPSLGPAGRPTCVHVRVAAQGALGGAVAAVSAPRVVPLVLLGRHPLQGVVVQAPGLGAQHRG